MKYNLKTINLLYLLFLFSTVALAEEDRKFYVINAANNLADNSAQIVTCTKTGRMIISTIGNLNFYDGTSFTNIDTRQEYQYQLPLYYGNYHLYFDRFHHIWLKNTHSVTCVNLLYETFVKDPAEEIKKMGCKDHVQDLFVDSIGHVWFLTDKGLFNPERELYYQVLKDLNLQDLDVFEDLLLTFYDNGEELALNLETGQIVHRTKPYEWDDAQRYIKSSIMLRYNDSYYIVRNGETESVLLQFDVKKQQWNILMRLSYHMNNIALHEDKLYIASEWGYWVYAIATGEQIHYPELHLANGKTLSTDCNTLTFDRQGGMWIGTEKRGVLYARPKASPFHALTWDNPKAIAYAEMMAPLQQNITEFNGKQANCMFVDSRNWSWFGTTTGLYLYKDPQANPIIFNTKNGLLNNVIHSIIEDKNHDLWISTSCGITCMLFEGEKIKFINSFNQLDNVPNESFVNCKAMCLDDGTIVMQAIDHVVSFHPDQFGSVNGKDSIKLFPKLIRILVNGNFVEPGEENDGNVIIDRAITRVRDISLNSNQNSVSLTFSGLNYFRPLQTYYRVRIKGLDDEWKLYSYFDGSGLVDGKGMLHLPLVNLNPGDYEIEVQASMYPDVWLGTPFSWVVHVNQPWWRATGVYIIIVVLILSLLLVNFIIYSRNMRMRTKRNAEEGDIMKKLNSFVDRCNAINAEELTQNADDLYGDRLNTGTSLSSDFVELMLRLMPYIQANNGQVSLHQLSKVGKFDIVPLYEILSANLYKSPRGLSRMYRLRRAAKLLRTTQKSVEEIATECGFYTPNYFMGNFFHEYKLTPREYREEHSGEA